MNVSLIRTIPGSNITLSLFLHDKLIKPGDKSGLNSDVFLIAPHRAQALEQFYLNKFGKKSNKRWNFFYRNDAILSKEWDPRYLTLWIPPQSKERIISQSNLNLNERKHFRIITIWGVPTATFAQIAYTDMFVILVSTGHDKFETTTWPFTMSSVVVWRGSDD